MVQAGFSYTNHYPLAIHDEITELRKELINILTHLEVLEKDSTSVGTAPTDTSSLSSVSTSRQQSANVTMEQQYQTEILKILKTITAKMAKLDKHIDEKKGNNHDSHNNSIAKSRQPYLHTMKETYILLDTWWMRSR